MSVLTTAIVILICIAALWLFLAILAFILSEGDWFVSVQMASISVGGLAAVVAAGWGVLALISWVIGLGI